MTTHSISWPLFSKMCLDRKGPYVTGPLMHVLNCLQQTKLWSGETRKLRWLLNGWKNVEQRSQDLVRRTLLFSLFTELESILCLNVSHNSQIVLKCFTEAGLPGNPDVLWGREGSWGGGPRQETLFLHFFPSRKKIVPFLSSSRIHLKWQAGENENKPFLGRPSTGKCIFDTSVGKWVSRIFWISSKLAVKANTIVLDGLLLFRMSLGTVQSFSRVLLDPADGSSVGNGSLTIIQGKPGIGKLPLRAFGILRHKRDQEKEKHTPQKFNYNSAYTDCAQKWGAWIWTCRSDSPSREGFIFHVGKAHIPIHSITIPPRGTL